MFRGLLRRELTLTVRDPGLRLALVGGLAAFVAAGLSLYVSFLGSSAPGSIARGEVLVARLMAIQWIVVCAVAPWAILRLGQPEQGADLVRLAALSRRAPWKVALARWAAGTLYLWQLAIVGIPVALLASQLSAARPQTILQAYLDLFLFLGLLALAVSHWGLRGRPGLATLGLAYLTALALAGGRSTLLAATGRANGTLALLAIAVGLGLWLMARSAGRLLYLDDGTPR